MSDLSELQQNIDSQFQAAFGRTPLAERVIDIVSQATALGRFTDLLHLREETGDLLCSALQLCSECGWNPGDLVSATLSRIAARHEIYAKLGRKLRVALLGGAFDPIHLGHFELVDSVLQHGGVDEVWLMPCYEHVAGQPMAAPEHRLEMCRIAVRSVPAVGVFEYEVKNQFHGERYHLIKKLLTEDIARLRCEFSLIIGQDYADEIAAGTNAAALERMIPLIVVPQAGCLPPKSNAWYLQQPHKFLADADPGEGPKSTEVRRLLRAGNPAANRQLPTGVAEYIQLHQLYAPDPEPAVGGPGKGTTSKTAILAGTFDPPGRYLRAAAQHLLETDFDRVVVCPAFSFAPGTQSEHAASVHRAALVDLNFRGMPRAVIDLSELERGKPIGYGCVEDRYAQNAEVWHVVGADLIIGGHSGTSIIHTCWENGHERWHRARFIVLHDPRYPPDAADMPPQSRLLPFENYISSPDLRSRVYGGHSIDNWLEPDVASYVDRHRLFKSFVPGHSTRLQILQPKLLIEYDERNVRAVQIADRYRRLEGDPPNLILVIGGDGTMLRAIRRHWRLRVPFLGLNAGHLGFLANERLSYDLEGASLVAYSLPMLQVVARTPDGSDSQSVAFSDAWIEREGGQAAWLRLDVDGQTRVSKVVGDGMLIATAAGSSAYARALGASPLPLDTPVLTLAGSNIFQPRFWKPMTLADDVKVSLVNLDDLGKRPLRAFVDGQALGAVSSLSVSRSAVANVELAFAGEFDPSTKLLRSLFPPMEAN
jgi:nicotinate (nicotinamide) nucleotide adenylyltransferase